MSGFALAATFARRADGDLLSTFFFTDNLMGKTYRVGIKIWNPDERKWIPTGIFYDVEASARIFAIAKALKLARRDIPGESLGWYSCQKIGKTK